MQIAICDDEEGVRQAIAEKVNALYPKASVILYESGERMLFDDHLPDILFLDIQMPGVDGMEAARMMRRKNRQMILIFVTGLEEYVFQAFDVGAFHYLVKPFSEEKFATVLKKAAELYEEQQTADSFRENAADTEKYLIVKSKGKHIKIYLPDIIYAEVYNRKVIVHNKQEDIEYYGKLGDLQKQAGEDFFRTHRAYLVHLKYVVKYNAATVWMEKGEALMAKKNYAEFVKSFMRYTLRTKIV